MEAVPMKTVLMAAATAGKVIGHDGCSTPVEVGDVMPAKCRCGGTGHVEVKMAGRVIARPACPGCADG